MRLLLTLGALLLVLDVALGVGLLAELRRARRERAVLRAVTMEFLARLRLLPVEARGPRDERQDPDGDERL